MRLQDKKLIAFIHIEKAAGQTINHILDNNYLYKHCRVAPLTKEAYGVFTANDMRTIHKINPFVEAISGHSIKPHSDLETIIPNIRYITLLRNPIDRYISHYQYWIQKFKKRISFEKFLELDSMRNFQTKKIAGQPNIEIAKMVLTDKVFLAGIVEEFSDFLNMLKIKLHPMAFGISYKRKNVAKNNTIKDSINNKMHCFISQITSANLLDIELYKFLKEELLPMRRSALSSEFRENLNLNSIHMKKNAKKEIIVYLYRHLYFDSIRKIIRYKNGLKAGGAY